MTTPTLDVRRTRDALAATGCGWCGEPVDAPQPGWTHGSGPAYCSKHHVIAGRHPWGIGQAALDDAESFHNLGSEDLLFWPWHAVNELLGPLVPRRLTYLAAFPSGGKTTFLFECIEFWLAQGKTITYLPLESDRAEVMTRLACSRANVNPNEALSKLLRVRADRGDARARAQLTELELAYRLLREDTDLLFALRIEPIDALTKSSFKKAIACCEAMQSDILIVDHVDHTEADDNENGSDITLSNALQGAALKAAKRLSIPVLLATQLNSSRTGGDRLAMFRPPVMDWLYNKGKKDQMAATVAGLYRPMDPDATDDAVKAVKDGRADPATILLANTMGVNAPKRRYGGASLKTTASLSMVHGRLRDMDGMDGRAIQAASAGITTGRSASDFGAR